MKVNKLNEAERKRLAPDEPLGFRERNKALWEAVDLNRRFVEDLDKSVRYAMVIFGVVNAGVFFLVSRMPLLVLGALITVPTIFTAAVGPA